MKQWLAPDEGALQELQEVPVEHHGFLRQRLAAGAGRLMVRVMLQKELDVHCSDRAVRRFMAEEAQAALIRTVEDLEPYAVELVELMSGSSRVSVAAAVRHLFVEHNRVCSRRVMRTFEERIGQSARVRQRVLEYWRGISEELFMPRMYGSMKKCSKPTPDSVLGSGLLFWISFCN